MRYLLTCRSSLVPRKAASVGELSCPVRLGEISDISVDGQLRRGVRLLGLGVCRFIHNEPPQQGYTELFSSTATKSSSTRAELPRSHVRDFSDSVTREENQD